MGRPLEVQPGRTWRQLAGSQVGTLGGLPAASPEPRTAGSSHGRAGWPSGQSVSGMGELVSAGRWAALCQRGCRGGFLRNATVRRPAPQCAAPATHQALFVQQGQVVFTQVDQRGHLLVEGWHLELSLSQIKESLYEGLQAHPWGQGDQC